MRTLNALFAASFSSLLLLLPTNDPALAQEAPAGAADAPLGEAQQRYVIIEGDIMVREEDFLRGTYATNLWVTGVVPYVFHPDVSAQQQAGMLAAMADWEAVANVDFRPRDGESQYVRILIADGNWSFVGVQGGRQDLSIVDWVHFTMVHELGHCLGYWHEQSRADRDTYIQVEYAHVCQDCCSGGSCDYNFDIRPSPGGEYGPYDFDSIMHYGACSFSCCDPGADPNSAVCPVRACTSADAACRTITVLPPYDVQWQAAIGQHNHLSVWDQRVMSFLYPQGNWRFVDLTYSGTELGTFLRPYDTLAEGQAAVPTGGTLWLLRPGAHVTGGILTKAMTIQAPLGGVSLVR